MEIDRNRATGALGGPSPGAPQGGALDRDAFMRLLVTQIRNQDPADPMDTRDLMTQLTQLTSVERLVGIEQRLTSLQVAAAGMANAQVASFVGATIEADTSTLRLDETNAPDGAFELPAAAETVTVTIRDDAGRVVRTIELGAQAAGARSFSWDGRDDAGNRLAPGNYRVEIAATGEEGQPLEARTRVRGVVTGVSYENGYPELIVGDRRVMMGDVREISRAAPEVPESSGGSRP